MASRASDLASRRFGLRSSKGRMAAVRRGTIRPDEPIMATNVPKSLARWKSGEHLQKKFLMDLFSEKI